MSEPEVSQGPDAEILPWRDVRREAVKASTGGWFLALGVPLVLAVVAGLVQWALEGGNKKAWDAVTRGGLVASVITFVVAIVLVVVVRLVRAPLVVARATLARDRKVIAELRTRVEAERPDASPLERWINGRIAEADQLARQRGVRGDQWYFGAMNDWDFANVQRMAFGDEARSPVAPDLVDGYRRDPRTGQVDGSYPPHDAGEQDRYYEQRKSWLRETLAGLRAGTIEPPSPLPEIPKEHREELQAIAAGLDARLALERVATYAPSKAAGSQPVAQSFRRHFPKLARALDEWDALVTELEEARQVMQAWTADQWENSATAGPVAFVLPQVVERDGDALPWVETDWLMLGGGFAMVEITEDLDLDAFKRPYDDLLETALDSDQGAALRRARLRVDAAKVTLHGELERIQALHVIRGRCDLCA